MTLRGPNGLQQRCNTIMGEYSFYVKTRSVTVF
jgi:hypothetical protein